MGFLCPAVAMAETIVVPASGSIGDALEAALPGDTVLLECGTFREQDLDNARGSDPEANQVKPIA